MRIGTVEREATHNFTSSFSPWKIDGIPIRPSHDTGAAQNSSIRTFQKEKPITGVASVGICQLLVEISSAIDSAIDTSSHSILSTNLAVRDRLLLVTKPYRPFENAVAEPTTDGATQMTI